VLCFLSSFLYAERELSVFLMDDDFILQNIVLSGCPQITTAFLYISVLPTYLDVSFKRRIVSSYTQCRGAANHSRVAEGTRPSPEGVYSGVKS